MTDFKRQFKHLIMEYLLLLGMQMYHGLLFFEFASLPLDLLLIFTAFGFRQDFLSASESAYTKTTKPNVIKVGREVGNSQRKMP